MTFRKSRNIYDEKKLRPQKPQKHEYPDIIAILNQSELKFSSEQELQDFLQYTFQMIHWTIARSFLKKLSKEEAHSEINQRLSWLENGIIKNKGG